MKLLLNRKVIVLSVTGMMAAQTWGSANHSPKKL